MDMSVITIQKNKGIPLDASKINLIRLKCNRIDRNDYFSALFDSQLKQIEWKNEVLSTKSFS